RAFRARLSALFSLVVAAWQCGCGMIIKGPSSSSLRPASPAFYFFSIGVCNSLAARRIFHCML
ncbi:unnamed protein product, partial [Amoebophrya sp. A120]